MFYFLFFILSYSSSSAASLSLDPISATRTLAQQKLPLYFEKNNGQHQKNVQFIAQTPYSKFIFLQDRVLIQLNERKAKTQKQFSLNFHNSQHAISMVGENESTFTLNYIRGSKAQWVNDVKTYSSIKYVDLYPGIDLVFYFNGLNLEYDFVVEANVDPSIIKFNFSNVENIKIENEQLSIMIGEDVVIQKPPIIYQNFKGKKHKVDGYYVKEKNAFQFKIAKYDRNIPLIIDPVLAFSSYFGGDWEDYASNIVTDSAGNVFLSGSTSARARIKINNTMTLENTAMPAQALVEASTSSHFFDGEIGLALSTEYLGQEGSSIDLINDEKITIVDGKQQREEFEYECKGEYTYKGAFGRDYLATDYDAFISKYAYVAIDLAANPIKYQLTLQYTTYFGGCRNDGIRDMVIDAADNLYIAGFTLSDNLPIKSGSQPLIGISRFPSAPRQSDAFYAKFNSNGKLIYSSYFGGNGRDGVRAIAVDSLGSLHMTGYTHSTDLNNCPLATGNVIQCEMLGGIELISNDDDLSIREVSYYSDAFVTKISPDGQARVFTTYFGGSLDDWGQSILVDETGLTDGSNNVVVKPGIYIAGNTSSLDLLSPDNGYSYANYSQNRTACSRINGEDLARATDLHFCEDAFLSKISLAGDDIEFTTYFGGIFDDNVSDMAIDTQRNIYLFGTSRSQATILGKGTALEFAVPNNVSGDEREILENIKAYHESRFPLYKHINKFTVSKMFNNLDNLDEAVFDPVPISSVAFLTIFKTDATALLMSSFIGGSEDDAGIGLTLNQITDDEVDVYLAGHSVSNDFFTQSAFQRSISNSDIFIVKLKLDLLKKDDVFGKDSSSECWLESCNLYNIEYSTLLGGEGLDALKDIYFSPFDNQLYLAGTTYSKMFPITDDALKTILTEVFLRDYQPSTRKLLFQSSYFPSDIFLMKLSDDVSTTDLSMTVVQNGANNISEGDRLNFYVTITADAASNDAKSVRLRIGFPYIASNDAIKKYITVAGANSCEMQYKQIYCLIGDMTAGETKNISIELQPRSTGSFPVSFGLMSQTTNAESAATEKTITTQIRSKPKSGANHFAFLSLLLLLLIINRGRLKVLHQRQIKGFTS